MSYPARAEGLGKYDIHYNLSIKFVFSYVIALGKVGFIQILCRFLEFRWLLVSSIFLNQKKKLEGTISRHKLKVGLAYLLQETFLFFCHLRLSWGCPRGVMVKAMDCGIVVREFVLQSRYYVHFRTNTLGKGIIPLILQAMG